MTGTRSAKPASQSPSTSGVISRPCLHQLFEAQAQKQPDAIAVTCGTVSLSYAELNFRANQLAAKLIGAGVIADAPIGLCMDRSIDLITGLLAILKAGGAYVPLDPSYPPDRLAHILDQAAPQLIVSRSDLHYVLPANDAHVIDLNNR